jgi:xanthine dehydrogenase YagR molybdenum-binding subunit
LYSSPLGGKSVGEIGVVGVAPAIANAVFHATGKRIRDLPIRMEHRM